MNRVCPRVAGLDEKLCRRRYCTFSCMALDDDSSAESALPADGHGLGDIVEGEKGWGEVGVVGVAYWLWVLGCRVCCCLRRDEWFCLGGDGGVGSVCWLWGLGLGMFACCLRLDEEKNYD